VAHFFIFGAVAVGRKDEILEKVRRIAAPLATQEGLELVDVELGGPGGRQTLRLFIDKVSGVSLDDCTAISRTLLRISSFLPTATPKIKKWATADPLSATAPKM